MDGWITQYDLYAFFLVALFSASIVFFFKVLREIHHPSSEEGSSLDRKFKVFAGGFLCTCSAVLFAGLVSSVSTALEDRAQGRLKLNRVPAEAAAQTPKTSQARECLRPLNNSRLFELQNPS